MATPETSLLIKLLCGMRLWQRSPVTNDHGDRYLNAANRCMMELFLYLALFFTCYCVFLSWHLDYAVRAIDWFPRSGAVLLIASVTVESVVWGAHNSPVGDYNASRLLIRIRSFFQKLAFALGILGTVIWAYGDKFIERFY